MAGDERRRRPPIIGDVFHGMLGFVFVCSLWGILINMIDSRPNKSEYNLHGAAACICLAVSVAGLAVVNRNGP